MVFMVIRGHSKLNTEYMNCPSRHSTISPVDSEQTIYKAMLVPFYVIVLSFDTKGRSSTRYIVSCEGIGRKDRGKENTCDPATELVIHTYGDVLPILPDQYVNVLKPFWS